MSYYKPTTFLQKIYKLIQLSFYYFRIAAFGKTKSGKAKHTGVLMVVSKLDRVGGVERQALEISSALVGHRCLITIVTDRIDDSSPCIEFRSGFLIRRLSSTIKVFRLFASLVLFLFGRRGSYQIVHAHGVTGYTIVSLFLSKLLGRPTVLKGATEDDFTQIFRRNNLRHRLYRKWILKADCFIAISEQMEKEMVSCGIPDNKIKRISNAVNSDKFSPASGDQRTRLRSRFSVIPDQTVFLFVGRLESRKAVDVLLQAWKIRSPGILWIVGSGPEEEQLKHISADLNLKEVIFHGPSEYPLDYFQAADVFVFPSLKEGSPGVVLEAMSCGLGCIATRIGGVVDQMQDGKQGLLIAPGSVNELADAIHYAGLHPDERLRWGQEARQTVLRLFDTSRISAVYSSLYRELLSR